MNTYDVVPEVQVRERRPGGLLGVVTFRYVHGGHVDTVTVVPVGVTRGRVRVTSLQADADNEQVDGLVPGGVPRVARSRVLLVRRDGEDVLLHETAVLGVVRVGSARTGCPVLPVSPEPARDGLLLPPVRRRRDTDGVDTRVQVLARPGTGGIRPGASVHRKTDTRDTGTPVVHGPRP